jgi:hypothetical protein
MTELLPKDTIYTWHNVDLSSNDKTESEPYVLNLKYDSIDKGE